MANLGSGGLSGHEAPTDPIFKAASAIESAGAAHAGALRVLDEAAALSGEPCSLAMIAWRLYLLVDLEAEEAAAAALLRAAEKTFLTASPATMAGGRAMLAFLQSYLDQDPEIPLAITAIANVAIML
jgi:hypothetical protein